MRSLIITGDGVEDSEFSYPYYRLQEEGMDVDVATPDGGSFESKHGQEFETADIAINDVQSDRYDLLVLPGGRAPENIRLEASGIGDIIRGFDEENKPIASVCHGAQLLITADVLDGREATGYWSIRDDIENAGATFVDEDVVVDGNLVCSRNPGDLPAFMRETLANIDKLTDAPA